MRHDCFHFQYLLFYEPLSLFLQHSRKINTKTIMSVSCGCKTYRSTRISKVIYCPYNWGKVYYALSFNFIFFPLSFISQATPKDMRITLQMLICESEFIRSTLQLCPVKWPRRETVCLWYNFYYVLSLLHNCPNSLLTQGYSSFRTQQSLVKTEIWCRGGTEGP